MIAKDEPGAAHHAKALRGSLMLAGENMGAHNAGERIAIGDPDPGKAQIQGLGDKLLRMRSAA